MITPYNGLPGAGMNAQAFVLQCPPGFLHRSIRTVTPGDTGAKVFSSLEAFEGYIDQLERSGYVVTRMSSHWAKFERGNH